MDSFLIIFLAGLAATGVMTGVLYAIHSLKIANADMIRAIGSLVTKKDAKALSTGLVIHFSVGVLFAVIYAVLISFLRSAGFEQVVAASFAISIFHGLVFAMVLVILVAEHHPLERFKAAGPAVAISHFVAHLFYGLTLGLIFSATNMNLTLTAIEH